MGGEVLTLGQVRRGDVAVAGGKGANLGEMVAAGFPIPPGFVVSAQACEAFFRHIDLAGRIEGLSELTADALKRRCDEIRRLICQADLPGPLTEAIMSAHADLTRDLGPETVYAVRSSATAEDLGEASFAGQHETYYYVTPDKLLDMVKHCWASLWSPEAVSYRRTQGISHAEVFMAVVVQEMIRSEVSGVTFTANPVSGDLGEIVTESSWGMGAAIVDGRVTPDHWVVAREGLNLKEKRIAEKKYMVPASLEEEQRTRLIETPLDLRKKETLTLDQIRLVSQWALKAEDHFGGPQDLEWAMAQGRFYLLQSRPITIMGREEIGRDLEGAYVIFKPIVENFTEPLTPLTAEAFQVAFSPPLMRIIKGWLYVSLRHIRTILPFKLTDEELAQMLYSFDNQPERFRLSPAKLPFFLAGLYLFYLFMGVFSARTWNIPGDFMDGFRRLARKVDEDDSLGPVEAMTKLFLWARFFQPVGDQVMLVNFTSLRYFIWMGLLQKFLRAWTPDIRSDAESLLCSGAEGVLSAEMGRGIWSLAKTAGKSPRVREILGANKPENALAELKAAPEAQEFLSELDRFLEKNGHRGLKELEMASPRWEENPAPVLGMVRNYLLVEADPEGHEKAVKQARRDLEAEIKTRLEKLPLEKPFRPRWRLLMSMARQSKHFSRMRENSRFYHTLGFYIIRRKVLRIEAELMAQGRLKCKGDVFYLKKKEMDRLRTGELGWLDVEDVIRERRMEYIRLCKMSPPKVIGLKLPVKKSEPAEGEGETFHGQSASPGAYQGTAHVILDPSTDIELKPGEILVAPYTDPAWTPLFLTAGAAVVEIGSYLSHAGTVAREFGMPCVVDLPDCTKLIHTGDRISVDGDHGLVRLMRGEEGES